MEFNTKLLHGKAVRRYQDGATLPAISQVSAFSYESAEQLEKVFHNKAPGYAYSRIANPVVDDFEKRVCELESGLGAVACSSGMAAITLALLNILGQGDEVIAGNGIFGGTIDLFENLKAFGITVKFVRHVSKEEIKPLITKKTKVVFGEVIGNPGLDIMDISEVAEFVHSKGIPLIVDSTTATPYLVNPVKLGADIVIHSTSKYINGGGNSISGVIIDSGNFAWDFEKFPQLSGYKRFGKFAYLARLRNDIWRNMGACLAPVNAFLNIVGMETLGLRMERICSNAYQLAEALKKMDGITVNYPLLEESSCKELADRQLKGMGGGILTIRTGTKERAYALMNSLEYALKATNIGDMRTLVIHPASTIYCHSKVEQREAAGVYEDTIRISVGIEDIHDLIDDFRKFIIKEAENKERERN